jgi:oligopeptide transport system substrate-binding protein
VRYRGSTRLAALFSTVLLASACSDGGTSTATEVPDVSAPSSPGAPPTAVESTPVVTPRSTPVAEETPDGDDRDVLRVAVSPPSTLDPMRMADPGSVLVLRQLFEGLTRWDPVARWVVPAAAASWTVSDGGTTFEFKLREGMTFHDGTPVTARDFKFAFDRIARKRNASDLAYTLDRVQGFVEFSQLGQGRGLKGVTAVDDLTLRIRLSEPHYDFPAVLTHPGLVPVPRDAVREINRFVRAPIGNGPFRIANEWEPGGEVVLDAFAGYKEPSGIDRIHFVPYANAAESWSSFERGQIDIAEVPMGEFGDASETYGSDGTMPFLAGYFYGVNLRAGALRDIRLRKALNFAVDRATIADEVYGGTMQVPRGVVPRGMPGFNNDACNALCAFTPDKARSLVAKLPRKLRRVRLEFTKGRPHGEVARLVAQNLRDAGLQVKLRRFEFGEYLTHLTRGNGGIYRYGWLAEYPDPDVFLTPLFDSGSPENYSGFESDRVDGLLDRAHAESNPLRRLHLYQSAERAVLKRVPVIPIGSFVTHWAAQPRVAGLEFDTVGGFDLASASIED